MSANTTIAYSEFHYDAGGRHVTYYSVGSSAAVPNVDMSLAYGTASAYVPGAGTISLGCVGYGASMRESWTWTGGYAPNYGWTQTGTGQSRRCVPTIARNGLPMSPSYSSGMIGSFQETQVYIYPR